MTSFKERLLSAEDAFLSALGQGGDALSVFDSDWESLMAEVDVAMDSNDLDPETTLLIQTTISRVAMLADTSIELVGLHDTFTSQFMNQLDSLMSELTLVDHPPRPSSSSAGIFSTTPSMASRDVHRRMPSLKRARGFDCLDSESSKRPRHGFVNYTPHKTSPSLPIRPRSLSPRVPLPSSPMSVSTALTENPKSDEPVIPINTNKRKRRLSESNASSSFPLPKRLYAGPRLHAASDSFAPRAIVSIPKTTSSDVPCANLPIKIHASVDPVDATTDEVPISGQMDPLSRLPLPSDFFLDSFIDSTWSQTRPFHDADIDTLVQSISQIVDQSAAHCPSDTPLSAFTTYGMDSPDTPGFDLSPASTPPYPATPLFAPLCTLDFFDGLITTNDGLAPDTLVGAANEDCITFQLPVTPAPKDPVLPHPGVADCGGSEAYWDLFVQPPEPFNMSHEVSALTLPKGVGASFNDIQLVTRLDF